MTDTPDKCPFCGAEPTPPTDNPENDYPSWECGTYIWHNEHRDLPCYERELAILRPKAEAMDRLEAMAKKHGNAYISGENVYFGYSTYQIDDGDGYFDEMYESELEATGPDLPSAIAAAWEQAQK